MIKDLHNKLDIDVLTNPATATSTVTSDEFDATDVLGVEFVVNFGESGDTLGANVYWTCKLQHASTTGGALTDFVAADYVIGPDDTAATTFGLVNAAADDDAVYSIGVSDNQTDRFFKVVVTPTGTHTYGTPIGILVVSEPKGKPASNLITPA